MNAFFSFFLFGGCNGTVPGSNPGSFLGGKNEIEKRVVVWRRVV